MRVYKYQNNQFFTFFNANDKGKNASDCVARAISLATGKSWEATIREMTELGIKIGRVFNEEKTIDKFLEAQGFIKYREPRKANNKKMTIREYLLAHPNFSGLINAGTRHITLVYKGKVLDTWDSSTKTMHCFWVPGPGREIKVDLPEAEKTKRRFTL